MPFGFGPEARISDRKDFGRVFQTGRKIVGRNLILWFLETSPAQPARLGLSISGKVGIAVRRNRLKRLAREAFRLNRAGLKQGRDFVIYFRRGCRWQSLGEAQNDFLELCRKAGLLET